MSVPSGINTSARGKRFEDETFVAIQQAARAGDLGLLPSACELFQRKSYFSRDRDSDIEFDISIEVTPRGSAHWSLLWVWECKDYSSSVPASDLEEFWSKLQQVAGLNVKGGLATNSSLQSGALNFAQSKGIAVVRILPAKQVRWVLADLVGHGSPEREMYTCSRAILEQDFEGVNRRVFGIRNGAAYSDWVKLIKHGLLGPDS